MSSRGVSFVFVLPLVLASSSVLLASTRSAIDDDVGVKLADSYGKLPLSFEANRGQASSRVKFLSRGRGYSLFLTNTEAVFSLRQVEEEYAPNSTVAARPLGEKPAPPAVGRMKLVRSNADVEVVGENELPGKSNLGG